MRFASRTALTATLLASLLGLLLLPRQADAQSVVVRDGVARVQLWEDADDDGVLGSAGDELVDAAKLSAAGVWSLDPSACENCGLVIDWGGSNGEIDAVGGTLVGGQDVLISGATVQLWQDGDGDGRFGGAADVKLGSAATDAHGAFTLDGCVGCGLVVIDWGGSNGEIDGWGGSNGEIDAIGGTLDGWGGSNGEIDGWGGAGDDIDWGGAGDDIDGWGGAGDDIDGWGGAGDDVDGWGGATDDVD